MTTFSAATRNVHCRVSHSVELVGHVLDGTVDVGFIINQVVPAGMITHHLCTSELVIVCRPGHVLAGRDDVRIDDLLSTPVVVYRWSAEAEALAEMFQQPRRSDRAPVHLSGLPTLAVDMVGRHDYVAVVPEFAAAAAIRDGRVDIVPLALPDWSLEVQLAHRGDAAETVAVTTLLAARSDILAAIQRDPAGPARPDGSGGQG